ncbi:TylF/MycF/NovP-related O-methyltransferase [Ruegeria sp. ANG-R]|uniref:TylF/MycF/NovP-related O-methyltransferase n=1 Tax=Ruegeria sp. ANG-R TaxID=1577903 RepID=UPI00068B4AE4|nr:TylF/MycF/NovP-related O-methyltransferase [Ruegeria sp. ANG-R]
MKIEDNIEGDAPSQSFPLLRRILPKKLHPFARGVRKRLIADGFRSEKPFCWTYPYTQVSTRRQDSILEKAEALVRAGTKGHFVECGVLDGGTAAILAYAARNDDRKISLFDAWEGMPEATAEDGAGSQKWVGDIVGSPKRVKSILTKVGARIDNIEIHRGWFEDTLPVSNIQEIAFLHIDCDFFSPTKLVLETFVPKVVKGGWVQIDDYTAFEGCRLAVNEFIEANPWVELTVEDVPGGAIYFRKH